MIKIIAHVIAAIGFLANLLTPPLASTIGFPMTLFGGLLEAFLGTWIFAIYILMVKSSDNPWYLLICAPMGAVSWITWGPFMAIVNGSPMQSIL